MSTLAEQYWPIGTQSRSSALTRVAWPDPVADEFRRGKTRSDFSETFDELQALQDEYGLDEIGSMRLTPDTLAVAHHFLDALPRNVEAPEVALDTDGEIAFDWTAPGGKVV